MSSQASTSGAKDPDGQEINPLEEINGSVIQINTILSEVGEEDPRSDESEGESEENDEPEDNSDSNKSLESEYFSSEPENSLGEESEDEIDISVTPLYFGDVNPLEGEPCFCKSPADLESSIALMSLMLNVTINFDNHVCVIDNIIRCYNFIFSNTYTSANRYRLAFADYFYRLRHEILFKLLCLSLNLPVEHSDISFSKFGIPSERTPDLIIERENVLYIIEVTATSSMEKAAQSKGTESSEFESKYRIEMDMLNDIGKPNRYLPLFFDMTNASHPFTKEQFNSLAKVFNVNKPYKALLDQFARSISHLTNNFKSHLILPSTILFSNVLKVPQDHQGLSFLYRKSRNPITTNTYKEMVISPYVYSKFSNEKTHLFWLLDNNNFKPETPAVFVIGGNSNRISLEQNIEGVNIETLKDIIINNNYSSLFENVRVKIGNTLIKATENEQGVKIYERTNFFNKYQMEVIPTISSHNESQFKEKFNLGKYKKIIEDYSSDNYHSLHYDRFYENNIINNICEFDQKNEDGYLFDYFPNTFLGNLKSRDIDMYQTMVVIENDYTVLNLPNDSLPVRRLKMKQPFILPIADLNADSYCPIENKNVSFINTLMIKLEDNNPYTCQILKNVNNENYSMYSKVKPASKALLDLESEKFRISNEINRLQKDLLKKGASDKATRISRTTDPNYSIQFRTLKENYNCVSKEIRLKKKGEGVQQNISYIRLPTKNKQGNLRRLYDMEMSHFKDKSKQSTIEGVGLINNIKDDYHKDLKIFSSICNLLCDYRGINPDKILDEYITEDAKLIKDLKEASLEVYKAILEQANNSCLGHAATFISRFAHSLMFYSQLPFSSDYVRVDNLGYKNVLLIVRGGKKIFKSKSSKLFRLVFPISGEILPWYVEGHNNKGSFQYVKIGETFYGVTPWSMLHESILTDSISFHHRIISFTILNLNPKIDLRQQFHKVSLNVLLGFHNRRQTEVILANLRYILLSTLGDFTGVTQILKEFFGFNYDRFQSFIRNSICVNYPVYFETLQKLKDQKKSVNFAHDLNVTDFVNTRLKNIFTNSVISTVEDLALMVYSTFLMTKAPYQKIVERANNVRGILEIHELFDKDVGLDLSPEEQLKSLEVTFKGDLIDYTNELFHNDFKFDPKFCALVGGFVDNLFLTQGEQDDIEANWIRILNQPWDEMATSTGLRGDYNEIEDFWGQKGYFVIYKKLLNQPGFADKLNKILSIDFTEDEKRRMVKQLNEVFMDKIPDKNEFLIFHAVDKVQWRGGREIYVMDLKTKTMQQPIEKFMAYLCKKLDNELISIPSDRRAQVIHHSIFEKDIPVKGNSTWFLTLDCSKWAPKSIFVKFVIMILNMRVVPNSFKTHFMNYVDKLYGKRVYFNKGEIEVLLKNPTHKDKVEKYLIFDKTVNGYYLEMPYSWVMGIFNYTSSFLHAANQKYFSYILSKTTILSYKEESSMVMFAHSDDSGGRLSVSSEFMVRRALLLYETFLKSCNHLLSKKKSVVSRIYFEILSVIYLFKKLLALLPKFLGGLRFLPTDKGPAQDLMQSYSKSIEIMVAGGDFSISYLVLKIYSHLVWKFYMNRDPTREDYNRPVQYLGMPDSHPLFILLCGSDADILRLLRNKTDLNPIVTFINTMSKTMDGEGPIKPLKFEIKVKGIKRGFEEFIESFSEGIEDWSIRNVNFRNTGLNTLSFLRKLNDSGFVGSLVNESTTRRISRAFFLRYGDSAITSMGNVSLKVLMNSINLCQSYHNKTEGFTEHLFKEILGESAVNSIDNEFEANKSKTDRTLSLFGVTLKSPLRIYKYLDLLELKGRKMIEVNRTLKPTLLQLVKSSKVFSNNFDPASLVSFIKEPKWRWALNDVRNLNTSMIEVTKFLKDLEFDIDEIDPDLLLRICRTYGRENTKSIYLYSRVPGEVRQIKTYSAFLTFLSVNSFYNKEIQGLTLKLSDSETYKEYLESNVNEEVHFINDVVSVLKVIIDKCGIDFVMELQLNEITEINWQGGGIEEFIQFIKLQYDTDVRYTFLKAQINNLEVKMGVKNDSAEAYETCAFYTFLESQKMRGGWYGKGEVFINIDNNYYSFLLRNNEITEMYTNNSGKLPLHHSDYIRDVFNNIGIQMINIKKPKILNYNKTHFGYDSSGDLSIFKGREIEKGVIATILDRRNCYVDNIMNYTIHKIENDWALIKRGSGDAYKFEKLNFLPVRKGELVPIMKLLLNPKDFEAKLLQYGLNDFEEFIYTEILTEYGKNITIDFEGFADNFQSSVLYQIFQEAYEKGYSKINKKIEFKTLPAAEGSLLRILIDYSLQNNSGILKVPLNLNPTIMQMRSEQPENVIALLGDKMLDYFKQIYTTAEQKEISDHYDAISMSEDMTLVRNSIIKLITYWGYGSLVHNIETFSLKREASNYLYFNKNNQKKLSKHFSKCYVQLIKSLNMQFMKWRPYFSKLEIIIPTLKPHIDPDTFMEDYIYEAVMLTYREDANVGLWISLYTYIFNVVLLTYMKEEDFVAELQEVFNSVHLLSSLPISWKHRHDIVSVINILRDSWVNENLTSYDIDYLRKNERLPENIPNFKSKLKEFDITISPAKSYYQGFLTDTMFSFILGRNEIQIGDIKYRISNKIKKCSEVDVHMVECLKHPAPLTEETLSHEMFEEVTMEQVMEPIDEDTILEYFSEIPKPHYKKSVTRKIKTKSNTIYMSTINWIVNPFTSANYSYLKKYRQVGENIIVITETYTPEFLDVFPNSGVRLVNLSKVLKQKARPLLVYYSLIKEFNKKDFLDKFIGGFDFRINDSDIELTKCNYTRSIFGNLCTPDSAGADFNDIVNFDINNMIMVELDGCVEFKKAEEIESEGEGGKVGPSEEQKMGLNQDDIKYRMVNTEIDRLGTTGILDDVSMNKMKNKYIKKSVKEGVSVQTILKSIAKEKDLISLNNAILSGETNITAEDQKKMFLNPEYFGVARALDLKEANPIKDKKVRSEINSLNSELAKSIGSNTLKLSYKFKKVVEANYKMWNRLYKSSKHKRDNKGFLLTLYASLCSNALVSDDEEDDIIWQDINNKYTVYMAQEEDDDEDETEFSSIFGAKIGSRLRYRAEGT